MSSRAFGQGSIVADRYRIVAPLGRGASARVFLADDLLLRRRVALKVLHEGLAEDTTFLKRFRAEVHAAAALNHPNLVHVYDSGDAEVDGVGVPFLVMEFVGGGTLRAVLDSGPLLTPSQALLVGHDAARGLEYAHEHGFVHRDIKPANLLFGEDRRLRIADFGIARALAEATWTEPEGVLLGTAKYSAPEQATGEPVDGRSDVYSLALVLVEAVTGEVPFARSTTHATLLARTERDLEVPRSLGRLASVLERAGRRDPELRPDAGELVIAFLAASEDMERPDPIGLPGAIPVSVLDALVEGTSTDEPPDAATETPDASEGADASPTEPTTVSSVGDVDDLPRAVVSTPPGAPADITVLGAEMVDPAGSDADETVVVPLVPSAAEADAAADGEEADRPARWRRLALPLLALAVLGGGVAVWWTVIRIPSHAVVDVVGMSETEATEELEGLGFEVSSTLVRRDGTEPDEVIEQTPSAGTDLEEGKAVELTVSLGNTLVTPPVLDSSMDEATVTAKLDEVGLVVGARTDPFDETVPAGFLVSAALAEPADQSGQVPKGTAMDIVISQGPQPRTIPPSLVGQPLAEVQRQLEAIQLQVNVTREFSDQPVDIVLSMNHGDNEQVPRDTVVEITVSKGPELIPIPNVIGQTGTDAAKALEAAGFPVEAVSGSPTGKVVGVAPPVGEPHTRGTPVRLLTN